MNKSKLQSNLQKSIKDNFESYKMTSKSILLLIYSLFLQSSGPKVNIIFMPSCTEILFASFI